MATPLPYSDTKSNLPILFFIHGWPDTGELFNKQVDFFSTRYRCVCVTLPGAVPGDRSKGSDFPELVERLAATINEIRKTSDEKITFVGHDWGAVLTYLLDQKYPHLASRLITLDVGARRKFQKLWHLLFFVGYQWWLMAAYFIGKVLPFLGNFMTGLMSTVAKSPRGWNVVSTGNYFYFYFWRSALRKKYRASIPIHYRPQKPILYLYGLAKPFHFHSARWEEIVNATPGSKVVGIERGEHWFLYRRPEPTNAAIDAWLRT